MNRPCGCPEFVRHRRGCPESERRIDFFKPAPRRPSPGVMLNCRDCGRYNSAPTEVDAIGKKCWRCGSGRLEIIKKT